MQFGHPYLIRLSFFKIQSNLDPVLNCRIRLDRDLGTGSCSSLLYTTGEHRQDQDWISCRILATFWIRIGFRYLFVKKVGSGQDQDICLISITKFSRG